MALLPEGSLKLESPTQAALLGAPTKRPGFLGRSTQQHTRPPYLQLDLLLPRNLTGQCGGGGLEDWAVMVGWGWDSLFQLGPLPHPPQAS